MSPVPNLTATHSKFAPTTVAGWYGVSVRAVAIQAPNPGRFRVIPRVVNPPRVVDRKLWWVNSPKARVRQRFNNDRRLVRFKLIMLGAIGIVAALLEVP